MGVLLFYHMFLGSYQTHIVVVWKDIWTGKASRIENENVGTR